MPYLPLYQYQIHTEPVALQGETITEDKWHQTWSEPIVKAKRGIRAAYQMPWTYGTYNPLVSFAYYLNLSNPVRIKPRLKEGLQQSLAFHPNPIISISWFNSLSEPKRFKPRLWEAAQQFFVYGTQNPDVSFSYFNWLTEPVRMKKGMAYFLQRADTQDPAFIPDVTTLLEGWYNWYSEPKRFKPSLLAALQKAWTGPDRLLPTPDVTGIFQATEINGDIALFVIRAFPYNPPASASVSIVEVASDGSATSIWEN